MIDKSKNYRSRTHLLLLYPDNDIHCNALDKITKSYDYAYILHDKDLKEDGENKKTHWHVVIRFEQARWASALCKELGIEENYIEETKSLSNALLYLVHFNAPEKAQYDIDDVKGPMKTRLQQELAKVNKSESEKVLELLDYIDSMCEPIRRGEFARFCSSMGYWSEYRRAGVIFNSIIDEHNLLYSKHEG